MKKVVGNLSINEIEAGEHEIELPKNSELLTATNFGPTVILTFLCNKEEKEKEKIKLKIAVEDNCPDLTNCKYLGQFIKISDTTIVQNNQEAQRATMGYIFVENS